ncbi:MAG: hypothetical protein AAFQ07_05440 [Chloroflexota bacterium]
MLLSFARRFATVIGSAMILLFFSEYYFLNEGPVERLITGLQTPLQFALGIAEFTLYYGLFTYIFFLVIHHFQVKTYLDLLLAGAIFGWATEALVVPIVYEAVPFSFVFPSISWHALIDVLLGWYLVRRIMRRNNATLTAIMFIVLGAIWGWWATWFWVDTNPNALQPLLPTDFVVYTIVTSLFALIGFVIADRFGIDNFQPSRWEAGFILAISILLFIGTAILFLPLSLALPPVIALTLFALHRSKANEHQQDRLQVFSSPPPIGWHYGLGLLMPLTASLIYPIVYENQIAVPTEDITALLLVAGFVGFVIALIRPFTQKRT